MARNKKCANPTCINSRSTADNSIAYFKFPRDKFIRDLWMNHCGLSLPLPKGQLMSSLRLCKRHFKSMMFTNFKCNRLVRYAVPSLHANRTDTFYPEIDANFRFFSTESVQSNPGTSTVSSSNNTLRSPPDQSPSTINSGNNFLGTSTVSSSNNTLHSPPDQSLSTINSGNNCTSTVSSSNNTLHSPPDQSLSTINSGNNCTSTVSSSNNTLHSPPDQSLSTINSGNNFLGTSTVSSSNNTLHSPPDQSLSTINSGNNLLQTNSSNGVNHAPPSVTLFKQANGLKTLPFFKTIHTLLTPIHCQTNNNKVSFSIFFNLNDDIKHLVVNSYDSAKKEFQVQIILRLAQLELEENKAERLPLHIAVSVNGFPSIIPKSSSSTNIHLSWLQNNPIDITKQTELRNNSQNKLQISWSDEPKQFLLGVFVVQKLTSVELIEQVKNRPLRSDDKTKELIKKSMESDSYMSIDSMFANIKDPLTCTRMELPARGLNCIHLQCFDAIQFIKMNELKQTWMCPLCKKTVEFESIEVDEYFLNIIRSPNLSKECEQVTLLRDGSWTEKQNTNCSNVSKPIVYGNQNGCNIRLLYLTDSEDED